MSTTTCVFCKIRDGQIPSPKLYEDDEVFVIRDINPKAPVHLLVIPRRHIETVSAMTSADFPVMARMTAAAQKVAQQEGIAESGYRLVINNGPNAGMEVWHLHLHVLGGRPLGAMG